MMLDLDADVPNGRLWIDPMVPDWGSVTGAMGLKLGRTERDLCFLREDDVTRCAVASPRGDRLTSSWEG
jgi:hypothetical protein